MEDVGNGIRRFDLVLVNFNPSCYYIDDSDSFDFVFFSTSVAEAPWTKQVDLYCFPRCSFKCGDGSFAILLLVCLVFVAGLTIVDGFSDKFGQFWVVKVV